MGYIMEIEVRTQCSECHREVSIIDITSVYQECGGLCCKFNIMSKFKLPILDNCNYKIGNYDVLLNVPFKPNKENISFYFSDTYAYINGIVQKNGEMRLVEPPPQEFFEYLQKIVEAKGVEGLSSICVDYWKGNKLARKEYTLISKTIEEVVVIR